MNDHPTPDPARDYASAWDLAQSAKGKLDRAIALMAREEEAESGNQEIVALLLVAGKDLSEAAAMIDPNYP